MKSLRLGKFLGAGIAVAAGAVSMPGAAERASAYVVQRSERPVFAGEWERSWNSRPWAQAPALSLDNYHRQTDAPYPMTQVKVLHSGDGISVFFRVEDRHVRSVNTEYMDPVWRDACVEFFFEPDGDRGYLNMEVNAGGTLLMKYHDPNPKPGQEEAPAGYGLVLVDWEDAKAVEIHHSLPKVIDPEISEAVTWYVQFFVPLAVLETYFGPLRPLSGRTWRVNFYKISVDNTHPHSVTWALIPPEERSGGFHQPRFFAPIRFE